MQNATWFNALQAAFFRWGWLLVAILPLSQLGGRALYTALVGIYASWGLPGLWSRRDRLDRATTLLYLALLGVMLLGIPGSVDPAGGLRIWVQFAAQTSTLLLMQIALRESPAHPDRLFGAVALFGGITLVGLYLLLPHFWLGWSGQPFVPSMQLQEDNLPFLLPFLLGWLWWHGDRHWRYGAMAGVTAAVLGYVVIAEGRAALLGFMVGLTVFCWLGLGWRLRWVVPSVVLVLAVGIAANTGPFHKAELDPDHPLDAFTTGRSILWRQALEHPPARPWLGVGIGNGRHATEVLSFKIGSGPIQVRHLHNFLMDAWYETGILGVGLLATLIGVVLGRLAWNWRRLSSEDRQRAGILLAAALALVTAGMLSFSYTSRQLACYFFVCLGGLIYFSQPHDTRAVTFPVTGHTIPGRN
jgi:O-antigen ligase